MWVDLPIRPLVTDSLLPPVERVGSWVCLELLDGLTGSWERLMSWLDTWSKGPRGPGSLAEP